MKENLLPAIMVVAGILIGVVIIAQFRSEVTANSYLVDEQKAEEQLFFSFLEDRNKLNEVATILKEKLNSQLEVLNQKTQNDFITELNNRKNTLGLKEMRGSGLEIVLSDGSGRGSESFVLASDIRDMVNLLRVGGAQGISINGQRIVASSTINSVGNTILINGVSAAPPFRIFAIGETQMLLLRMNDKYLYTELSKRIIDEKIGMVVSKLENLVIPAYGLELNSNFIKKYE